MTLPANWPSSVSTSCVSSAVSDGSPYHSESLTRALPSSLRSRSACTATRADAYIEHLDESVGVIGSLSAAALAAGDAPPAGAGAEATAEESGDAAGAGASSIASSNSGGSLSLAAAVPAAATPAAAEA